jgi:surfeit locus 1 family protein
MSTSGARPSPRITIPEIAGTIVVLAIALVCFRLCAWQLARLHERRAANAAIAARLDAPALPGFESVTDTTGALYRRLRLHGRFDDARAIVLPGRSLFGSPGVHLLAPLVLSDGSAVLVNRGWVPSPDGATIDYARVPHETSDTIVGLMLAFPGRSASIAQNADPSRTATENGFRRVWYAIDEQSLRAQFPYPLAPFVLQILPASGDHDYPKRIAPPALDEGPHLSYAIQWFSFAIIFIVGWITFLLRRRAERSGSRSVIAPPHPPAI